MIKDLKNFTSTMSVLKDLMDMSSDQSKINETVGHLEDQMKNYRPKMNLSFVNKSDNPYFLTSRMDMKFKSGLKAVLP